MRKLWLWEHTTNSLLDSYWLGQLQNYSQLYVGFSGGLDSTVLLHTVSRYSQLNSKLIAVHVNHALSPNADAWQTHCQAVCQQFAVRFIARPVDFNREANLEAHARNARYAAFTELLGENDAMLLAHHADDQAETVLLNLLRGGGVDGLAAMPQSRSLGKGILLRPFLTHARLRLEQYAKQEKLQWIEDESNRDIDFSRNYLRHEIIPRLVQQWPGVVSNLQHTATICQQAQANLDALALMDGGLLPISSRIRTSNTPSSGEDCVLDKPHPCGRTSHPWLEWSKTQSSPELGSFRKNDEFRIYSITHISADELLPFATLSLQSLLFLDQARLFNVLRYWFKNNQVKRPSLQIMKQIFHDLINAKEDANPVICWSGVELRRYQNTLYLLNPNPTIDTKSVYHWDNFPEPLHLGAHRGVLYAKSSSTGVSVSKVSRLSIRYRQGGETLRLNGHTKKLKQLIQTWQIPPWQRNTIPLLYDGDRLIAVIGYAVADV